MQITYNEVWIWDHNVGYKDAEKHTASILSRLSIGDDSMFLRNSTHLPEFLVL